MLSSEVFRKGNMIHRFQMRQKNGKLRCWHLGFTIKTTGTVAHCSGWWSPLSSCPPRRRPLEDPNRDQDTLQHLKHSSSCIKLLQKFPEISKMLSNTFSSLILQWIPTQKWKYFHEMGKQVPNYSISNLVCSTANHESPSSHQYLLIIHTQEKEP